MGDYTFSVNGPLFRNDLSKNIKESSAILHFQKLYKTHRFSIIITILGSQTPSHLPIRSHTHTQLYFSALWMHLDQASVRIGSIEVYNNNCYIQEECYPKNRIIKNWRSQFDYTHYRVFLKYKQRNRKNKLRSKLNAN